MFEQNLGVQIYNLVKFVVRESTLTLQPPRKKADNPGGLSPGYDGPKKFCLPLNNVNTSHAFLRIFRYGNCFFAPNYVFSKAISLNFIFYSRLKVQTTQESSPWKRDIWLTEWSSLKVCRKFDVSGTLVDFGHFSTCFKVV